MNIFKRIKSRFTMEFVSFNIHDKIGGCDVSNYKDCYDVKWIATSGSPLAWRVMIKEDKLGRARTK